MKKRFSWFGAIACGTMLLSLCCASAQDKPAAEPPSATNEVAAPSGSTGIRKREQTEPLKAENPVKEVVQMLDAGVSKEVVKAYVQQAPAVYTLRPADLVALKEHSVPDEITTAMLEKGKGSQKEVEPSGSLPARLRARGGGLDPESYDFWWYHYAYPRALASANQRLLSGPGWAYSGDYAYPPGLPFMPQRLPRWTPNH